MPVHRPKKTWRQPLQEKVRQEVIALPIIIPLAMNIGVSMPLVVGACISAGVFGSHICFYSDAT
ncbi:MAG: hypothetical protein IKC69_04625, partial [Clostridia bacterium]|nr:hypothetical protein [Clostridia bacterium]